MNATSPLPAAALPCFGETAAIRCERAAAELRAGRPVVITEGDRRLATMALDSASPAGFAPDWIARLAAVCRNSCNLNSYTVASSPALFFSIRGNSSAAATAS